jgi:hypothetical protein
MCRKRKFNVPLATSMNTGLSSGVQILIKLPVLLTCLCSSDMQYHNLDPACVSPFQRSASPRELCSAASELYFVLKSGMLFPHRLLLLFCWVKRGRHRSHLLIWIRVTSYPEFSSLLGQMRNNHESHCMQIETKGKECEAKYRQITSSK